VQLISHQLIADYLIGDEKCIEKRNLVNGRLNSTIKLIFDYVIKD